MKCPTCHCPDNTVIDSRPVKAGTMVWRRRKCAFCSKRFTTYERIEIGGEVADTKSGGVSA
jgi:transcriptional repressor NrdR